MFFNDNSTLLAHSRSITNVNNASASLDFGALLFCKITQQIHPQFLFALYHVFCAAEPTSFIKTLTVIKTIATVKLSHRQLVMNVPTFRMCSVHQYHRLAVLGGRAVG